MCFLYKERKLQSVYILKLGCEKNTVDAEYILGILKSKGHSIVDNPEEADVIIINTCAFIEDAKKESIEEIFNHLPFKQYGKCKRLIVSGCLSERYKENFIEMFKEVDAAIGVNDLEKIIDALEKDGFHKAEKVNEYREYNAERVNTESKFSRYIRISDGCNLKCSFCAIPNIRGEYRSRTIENIALEVEKEAKSGVKEINLIAQETTFYGYDLYKEYMLPKLLQTLSCIYGIEWIRVLYQNPNVLSDEIIKSFFTTKKVLPYFDIPMQHISKSILTDMNRAGDYNTYKLLVKKIRGYDNNAAIRTSLIVGFPGETKEDVVHLVKFIKEAELDRVGVFTYSEEEDTEALTIDKDKVSKGKALKRREVVMRSAISVSEKRLERLHNKDIDVLVEGYDEDSNSFVGRSIYDAPEVDGIVYIEKKEKADIKLGDILNVKVNHSNEYDLFASVKK